MTYREEFLATRSAEGFRAMVETTTFTDAVKTAMLVYTQQCCTRSADPTMASANNFRLDGAREFLETLKAIAKEIPPRAKPRSGQLNHSLK